MNRLLNWLRNFMSGRYGTDQLSLALLIFYLILGFLGTLTGMTFFHILAFLAAFFCVFRMLSRDFYRRRSENQRFLTVMQPVFRKTRQWYARLQDRDHRYYRCPCCKQLLRVPRGRGKITITCPRCRNTLTKNS